MPIPGQALRRLAGCVTAGSLFALALPAIQGAIVRFTTRPAVPGPFGLDRLHHSASGGGDPLSIVWLGDSLAAGVGADCADSAFPARSAARYAQAHDRSVQLTCLAQPGACAADVITDQLPKAVARLGEGMVAVLTVGSNDVASLTGPRRFARRYDVILEALTATGATVVAVGLPDMGAVTAMAQPLRALAGKVGRRASRQVHELATSHGAHYLAIDHRPPRGTKCWVFLAADRWHPNSATYGMWADAFVGLLGPIRFA